MSMQPYRSVDLFDYAVTSMCTISCEYPATNNYDVENLLSKSLSGNSTVLDSDDSLPILIGNARTNGFMAESFVKPPVEIVLQFPYELSLAAVVVDPRIRMHSAKMISVLIWNKRFNKWEYSGRLTWENEDNTTPQALCNRDLEPQVVSYSAQLHGSQLCRSLSASQWLPLEKHEEALHHVSQIKVRINSMHRAQTLGLGRLEIWAQPSQRMHPRQRNEAWQHIFRLRESTRRLQTTTSTSQIQSRVPDNIPCEFVDVITQTIMLDPVILPSGARCDRSTITKHLSVKNTDPFTGLSLDIDQVKPDLLLGQRIKAWLSGS